MSMEAVYFSLFVIQIQITFTVVQVFTATDGLPWHGVKQMGSHIYTSLDM